jgi:hypothetical protein
MPFRFEFDPVNKILLARLDGQLTDELLAGFHEAAWKCAAAIDPQSAIVDLSSVTEFSVSGESVRQLARQRTPLPNSTRMPRVIVAPQTHAFGLFRMFQIAGERTRPLLSVVHTMDEAYAALGVKSPNFEPLE